MVRCRLLRLLFMMNTSLKHASTLFLKAVLLGIGVATLGLCAFLLPYVWKADIWEVPEFSVVMYPATIGFFGAAIPFFFALYQAFMLLQYIDRNIAFSEASVIALRFIKYSAVAMSILYAFCMPAVVVLAELDDAPGAVVFGMAAVCSPLIVATFAAVLQKLIQNAIDLKQENDLTI